MDGGCENKRSAKDLKLPGQVQYESEKERMFTGSGERNGGYTQNIYYLSTTHHPVLLLGSRFSLRSSTGIRDVVATSAPLHAWTCSSFSWSDEFSFRSRTQSSCPHAVVAASQVKLLTGEPVNT